MQIYEKQSFHNPLIKDKGSLSHSEQQHMSSLYNEDERGFMRDELRQTKVMSCRVTSTFEHTPIIEGTENNKVRGDYSNNMMRITQSMHVTHLEELKLPTLINEEEEEDPNDDRYILECGSQQQLTLRPPVSSNDSSSSDYNINENRIHEDVDASLDFSKQKEKA